MGNVVNLNQPVKNEKPEVGYQISDNGKVVGVSHDNSPYTICTSEDGSMTGMVCADGEAFGEMKTKEFNSMMLAWLLISDPSMVDGAGICDKCSETDNT